MYMAMSSLTYILGFSKVSLEREPPYSLLENKQEAPRSL
jgi:hypothetical protein